MGIIIVIALLWKFYWRECYPATLNETEGSSKKRKQTKEKTKASFAKLLEGNKTNPLLLIPLNETDLAH